MSYKINLLIIGKKSLLSSLYQEYTSINNYDVFSHKEIKKIDFTKYSHLINFSYNPLLRKKKYNKKIDFDYILALIAKKFSITYIMISSRVVYPSGDSKTTEGIKKLYPQNIYGKNKLIVERNIKKTLKSNYLILRLSTVLYDNYKIKKNLFYYKLLKNLKLKNKITMSFDNNVFKDFITPHYLSRCIDNLIIHKRIGIYNISSGIKIYVKKLAETVLKGYGCGSVEFLNKNKNESFCISNKKIFRTTKIRISESDIINYAFKMGKSLKR